MSFKWRKVDFCLVLMLALSMAFYIAFVFLPNALDLNGYAGLIEKKMEDRLQRGISIEAIHLDLTKGLGVRIGGFSTDEDGSSPYSIRVDELYVRIKILPLLRKRVVVDRIDLLRPRVKLRLLKGEDPLVTVLNKIKGPRESSSGKGGFSVASLNSFYMKEGFISIADRSDPSGPPLYQLSRFDLLYRNFPITGPPSFRASGLVRKGSSQTTASVSGRIKVSSVGAGPSSAGVEGHLSLKGFEVERYWEYLRRRVPFRAFAGNMDIETDFSFDSGGRFSTREGRIHFTNLLIDYPKAFREPFTARRGDLTWQMRYDGRDLTFPFVSADLGDLSLNGILKVGHVRNGEKRTVLADFAIDEFVLKEGRKYFPTTLIPGKITRFIDERISQGKMAIDRIRVAGRIADFHHLSDPANNGLIYAEARGRGMVANVNDETTLEGVVFDASLEDGDVNFNVSEGRFAENTINRASGIIRHIYAEPLLEVKTSAHILLPETLASFSRYIDPEGSYDFLRKVELTDGTATAEVSWKRPLSGGGGNSLSGKLQLKGCSFLYPGLSLPMKGLTGQITFSNSYIKAEEVRGLVGSSSFTVVTATKVLGSEEPSFKGKVKWQGSYEDLVKLLPSAEIRGLRMVGNPQAVVNFEAAASKLSVKASLDLTSVRYSLGDYLRKAQGKPNTITISAQSAGEGGIHFDQVTFTAGSSVITLMGDVGGEANRTLDMSIAVPYLDFQEIRDMLPAAYRSYLPVSGRLGGAGSLKGPLRGRKADLLTMNMAMENLIFSDLLNRPFVLQQGRFSFRNGSFCIEPTTVEMGGSTFSVTGHVGDLPATEVELKIYGDAVSLKDFFTKGSRGSVGSGWDEFLKRIDLSADISFKTLDVGKVSLDNFRTSIRSSRDGNLEIRDIRFDLSDGRFEGDLARTSDREHGSTYRMSKATLDGLDVNKLMRKFIPSVDMLSGYLTASVDSLEFKRDGPASIKDLLDGSFSLKITDGSINRFKVLSSFLSLLNLQPMIVSRNSEHDPGGLVYKSIEGDFNIRDGVLTTENLEVDSNAMKIKAAGKINLADNRFEPADYFKEKNPELQGMLIMVQPLYLMDSLFSNLPIFQFIAGDKKSLISAFFDVSGKLDDPEVKSVQLSSLRAGILDRLEKFFKNPITLLFNLN